MKKWFVRWKNKNNVEMFKIMSGDKKEEVERKIKEEEGDSISPTITRSNIYCK